MKCHQYLIVFLILCLVSCSYRSEMSEKLSAVESIMEEHPDSALQVLKDIDTLQLKSRKDKALYALLLSQAWDKNYVDVKSDSIISTAVDYFENSGDTYHSMLAHYYQGRVLYNAGQYPQSLIITLKAYEEAQKLGDKFWTAMSARSIWGVYTKTHYGPEGIRYAQIAVENFKASGYKRHHLWAIVDLATAYNNNGDYEKSVAVAQEALDSAIITKDTTMQTTAIDLIGTSYFGRDRYAEAIPYYIKVCSDRKYATAKDSAHLAILYLSNNQPEKARPLIDAVSDNTESFSQWMKYEFYSKTGNMEKALKALEAERKLTNKILHNITRQNLNGTLTDYNAAQELKREAELRTMQLVLAIIILIALVIISATLIYIYRQRAKTESYMNLAMELTSNLEEYKKSDNDANTHLRHLMKSRFMAIDNLLSSYQGYATNESTKQKIVDEIDKFIKEYSLKTGRYKELEEEVNNHVSNLMENLRSDLPGLKEIDYAIYLYTSLGLTTPAMVMLLNAKNASAIYNRKKRIRERLKELPEEKCQYYMAFLG